MTSSVEFEEQANVAPEVIGVPFPLGSTFRVDALSGDELRIPITVRDSNVDDLLEIRFWLRTAYEPGPFGFDCPGTTVMVPTTGQPNREPREILIDPSSLKIGQCHLLEVMVSSRFVSCRQVQNNPGAFGAAADDDLGIGWFSIHEISQINSPLKNSSEAAKDLLGSCVTVAAPSMSENTMTPPIDMRP